MLMNARLEEELFICADQRKSAAHRFFLSVPSCPLWLRVQFIRWLGEALAVAFLDAAHGSEQMGIGSCTEALRLPVEHLHHQSRKCRFALITPCAAERGQKLR